MDELTFLSVECKARFTSSAVAADTEVEIEVYLRIRCPFPVRFSKVSISLNHQVGQEFCLSIILCGCSYQIDEEINSVILFAHLKTGRYYFMALMSVLSYISS